jgi:hypothetical protein
VFVVLKPVRYVDHDKVVDATELAISLGPRFVVVTVRHSESDVLNRVREELDKGNSKLLEHGPTGVPYRIADLVVDGHQEAIDYIRAALEVASDRRRPQPRPPRWLNREEEAAWRAIAKVIVTLPWALECQLQQDAPKPQLRIINPTCLSPADEPMVRAMSGECFGRSEPMERRPATN